MNKKLQHLNIKYLVVWYMQPPTPGIIAYTNIQSITNQSINPGLNSLIDWLYSQSINQSTNLDCLIASLLTWVTVRALKGYHIDRLKVKYLYNRCYRPPERIFVRYVRWDIPYEKLNITLLLWCRLWYIHTNKDRRKNFLGMAKVGLV